MANTGTVKFQLGVVVQTQGIAEKSMEDPAFRIAVTDALSKHVTGDWGDVSAADKLRNDQALIEGGRLLSSYHYGETKFWIITEYNRSVTTVLFSEEY